MKQKLLVSFKGAILYITLYLGARMIMMFLKGPAMFLILVYPLILSALFIASKLLVLTDFSFRWILQALLIGSIIFVIFFIANVFFLLVGRESDFLIIFTPIIASLLYVVSKIKGYSWLYVGLSQILGGLILVAVLLIFYSGGGEMEALMIISFTILGFFIGIIIGLFKDAIMILKTKSQQI